ncbi:subtilisin-like protein [Thozetella sp. PMI_491]|nr:subtilisin-like protein [Thozetella sp. PMI_491]
MSGPDDDQAVVFDILYCADPDSGTMHELEVLVLKSSGPVDSEMPPPSKRLKKNQSLDHLCQFLFEATMGWSKPIRLQLVHENTAFTLGTSFRSPERLLPDGGSNKPLPLGSILSAEWNYMSKLVLAVTLAYSLYHLYGSPWVGDSWAQSNILFFKMGSSISLQPYLRSESHLPPCAPSAEPVSVPLSTFQSLHSEPGILLFGVTLLEIHLGQSMESYTGQQLKTTNQYLFAAQATLDDPKIQEHMTKLYRKVVRACLNCNFGETCTTKEELRRQIYKEIVKDMEQELDHAFGDLLDMKAIDKKVRTLSLQGHSNQGPLRLVAAPTLNPPPRVTMHANGGLFWKEPGFFNQMPVMTPSPSRENIQGMPARLHGKIKRPYNEADLRSSTVPRASRLRGCVYRVEDRGNSSAASWFTDLKFLHLHLHQSRREPLSDDENTNLIKMAVIDTGIDLTHPEFVNNPRIVDTVDLVNLSATGISSLGGEELSPDTADLSKGIQDLDGHGTHIAHTILQTAPYTNIYVARAFDKREAGENTAALVAKAIRHAVEVWEVDMIVMAFAFEEDESEIERALELATSRQVLMFAAASNFRANADDPVGFPARAHDFVFCVNSSDAQDKKSNFSPHAVRGRFNFSAVGEGVKAAWPAQLCRDHPDNPYMTLDGTSSATAIAAGISALVLEFSRRTDLEREINRVQDLHTTAGMRNVLFRCMSDGITDGSRYNYLKPGKLFRQENGDIISDINRALKGKYKA